LDRSQDLWQPAEVELYKGGEPMSLATHLAELERKHRTLDTQIEREQQHANADPSKVASLKRRKLLLKDEIVKIQQELVSKTVH
jgi:hypothetical protein